MERIREAKQVTHNRFLNYYELSVTHKNGKESRYFMASRAAKEEELYLKSRKVIPNGVAIYALYGEKKDKVVLVRQYRYPLGGYVYEFPAGLVEAGEDYHDTAVRELKEETGLLFSPIQADPMYEVPRFTSVGMTDENCAMVYGYASGEISTELLEEGEDLEIVLADKEEVRRILKEEDVALILAYQLMHFLKSDAPFDFLEK